ncbi:hypothetical protein PAXRUDRAFT_834473 [Paxillus rubicundulus Ve08.2h10]|uniref:Uncharacterized protein n=1 Tax=Paxillus rubicundulus Ve08.2h10 TaxID=930991 RepID=A0A0D0CTI3_9AGAM|nr:hypothetical protein PAXRUDRAFT_834473 [Paxillus rubicundulus Ve08.2h10]
MPEYARMATTNVCFCCSLRNACMVHPWQQIALYTVYMSSWQPLKATVPVAFLV